MNVETVLSVQGNEKHTCKKHNIYAYIQKYFSFELFHEHITSTPKCTQICKIMFIRQTYGFTLSTVGYILYADADARDVTLKSHIEKSQIYYCICCIHILYTTMGEQAHKKTQILMKISLFVRKLSYSANKNSIVSSVVLEKLRQV